MQATSSPIEKAIHDFEKLLGEDSVLPEPSAQDAYGPSTIGLSRTIVLALRPKTKEQVVGIVKIAAEYKVALYPISTGKNWGYGSSTPANEGSVIVDLSQLNRIIHFDDKLGLVTLEPGVTQQQLKAFLDEHGYRYMIPATGGGGGCSIIGNALERGHGAAAYGDRFASIISTEVVLADGTIYSPAFFGAEYPFFKWGIGPHIDGLFGQSNLGIVTSATMALARQAEKTEVLAFTPRSGSSLASLVDISRELLAEFGENHLSIRLQDIPRLATRLARYPKESVVDGMIQKAFFEQIAYERNLNDWFILIGIRGSRHTIRGNKRAIKARMKEISAWPLIFLNQSSIRSAQKFIARLSFLSKYTNLLRVISSYLSSWAGTTAEDRPGRLPYWKLLSNLTPSQYNEFMDQRTLDPDDAERCGLIFYSGLTPIKGEIVETAIAEIREICKRNRMEALIAFSSFTEHSFYLSLPLLFDRKNDEEKQRAYNCYRELQEIGRKRGFPLYRAGIQAMDLVVDMDHPFWQTAEKIKKALDPDNIMSPGRYSKYKRADEK